MEKPLISFIIPYYELPVQMLCECIESVLALSLRNIEREIIIIDDGSSKSPVETLTRYEQDIIYIRQPHQGLSEARNTGIRMATGTYLQFLDSDDLLVRSAYEHCLDLIRFTKPEMVVFDFTTTASEDKTYIDQPVQSGVNYMRNHNIRGTAWGYVFQQSVLGNLRFTPGISHEDEEFTPLLLLRAETVCVTDAEAYLYRQRPDSITNNSETRERVRRLEDFRAVISRLNTSADRLPVNEKTALQRRIAQLTMDYLYNVIRLTGSRHYLESKIDLLRQEGLFPLPDKDYSAKYTWFRRLSNSNMGLSLLMRIIPLMKKER